MRMLLARHGETEWNALGRLQGHTDIPLNERGRQQARELAHTLGGDGLGRVVTSDLRRARETGAIVSEILGLPSPVVIPQLRERCFGVFEGLTREQCSEHHPVAWRAWQAQTGVPDGAEDLADAAARMDRVLRDLVADGGPRPLVVSHGGIMRLWLVRIVGASPPPLHNGVTYVVDHDGAEFRASLRATP